MKKRLLALVTTVVLILNLSIMVNATTVEGSDNAGWSYEEATSTLILTNYTATDIISVGSETYQIHSDGDLNIVLVGTNTLNLESTYGIYVEGNLTISGSGTLNVANTTNGIYATKNITVESGTVNAPSIQAGGGGVTISGGKIELTGAVTANSGLVTIDDGEISANHISGKEIVINGGNVSAHISGDNLVEINGGTINARGISVDLYETLRITGGTIVSKVTSGAAIDASASISISGGDITLEGPQGIYGSQMSLRISGGTLKVKATEGDGITQNFNMTNGCVEIEASGNGISNTSGNHSISGGTLKIKSEAKGIYSDWSGVDISGGNVTIEAGTYGLYAGALSSGGLRISGGEAVILGKSNALYSNGYITLGGVYELGSSADRASVANEYYGEKYFHISYNGNIDTTPKVFPTQIIINGQTTSTTQTDDGWKYDSESKTLTLNGFSSTQTSTTEETIYQIHSDGDLNIVLVGTNTLNLESTYGIYVEGNLTISGSGTLNVSNTTNGIYATKNITVESGMINAPSIQAAGGGVTINGGKIELTGAVAANSGLVTITDGEISANRILGKEIVINGGNISAYISGDNLVEINGGTVNARGISVDLYETLRITGGTIVSKVTSGAAIDASASISISGGDITLEGPQGIYGSQMSLRISGGTLKVKATEGDGITQDFNMTNGYVEIEASGNGISNTSGDHSISGGTLKIKSGAKGIYSDWSGVDISGGNVTIEAGTYGLYAGALSSGGLRISGGIVSITGNEQALYSKGYTSLIASNCISFYIGNNINSASNTVEYYNEKHISTKETHTWKEATCILKSTCDRCGKVRGEVDVNAHIFDKKVAANKYLKSPASCSSAAVYYKSCACGAKGVATFTSGSQLSHKSDGGAVTKKATCSATGTKTYKCTLCNAIVKTETIEKIAHKYDSGVVTKNATCKTTGIKTYTCSNCKETRIENIAKSETHLYTNACDTACNECGFTRATTHSFGDYVYNNDATAAKDGTKTRTCSVCGKKETITASGTKWTNPFGDVKASEYFHTPVLWAVANKVTSGTSATTFSPNDACTRGQIVTFLWRAAGSPAPKGNHNPFKDVKSDQYYYKAVLWAVENGITSGTSATTFSPNDACTRGQIVTFLWRAAGSPAPKGNHNPFKDVKSDQYYYKAVLWAVENGITSGTSATTFEPDAACTRGQIVTFLYRSKN